jgi:hypothetical protein
MAVVLIASSARAEQQTNAPVTPPALYRSEISGGTSTAGAAWSAYGAMTYSFSGDIRLDGVRMRSGAGYGEYRYDGLRWNDATQSAAHQSFKGTQAFADLLLGYQKSIGPLTVKAFAGIAQLQHDIAPFDPENLVQGQKFGAKLALETWLNIGDIGFVQADASWSQPFGSYASRLRAGYRLPKGLSVGPEIAFDAIADYAGTRRGGFLRFEWERGEVSAAVGLASERGGTSETYGTINMLIRF